MSKRIIALLLCLILFLTAIPVSTSAAQTLTITNQPQNAYVSEGEVAKTTVTAQGDGLQYQWYVKTAGSADFVKSSVTKKAYSFTMSAKSSGRQAYCVITDQHGNTVTTDTVTMKIPVPLKILSQPANSYVETGKRAVTSVIAQGEDLQYQWYLKMPARASSICPLLTATNTQLP